MTSFGKDKVILVTGGTGSFGNEFVKTLLESESRPKKIIVFSRDEMKQYEMSKRIHDPDQIVRFFVGDIRDKERLYRAFTDVDIVVHAAALKIVPTAEYNPFEVVQTNILGTENVVNAAIDRGVKKVLALSTDKAANPINLYGATKLCLEKMVIAANNYSPEGTRLSVVRYGNVFGSRGSVVPFFKKCRDKGVVPITHPEMTRFWITLKQGVDLVVDTLESMKGGEIIIPKLPSIKIKDLAEAICPDCKQEVTGIRPGEKLHEALVASDDGISTYEYEDKYITYSQIVPEALQNKKGEPLGVNFPGYRSDNNTVWLSKEELLKMIEEEEHDESYTVRSSVN